MGVVDAVDSQGVSRDFRAEDGDDQRDDELEGACVCVRWGG